MFEPHTPPGSVLFTCNSNAVRSPMAEAILKHLCGHRIYVQSCGVHRSEINGFVIDVMEEIGIDVSGHQSKSFADVEETSFDWVISLTPEAQHQAIELTRGAATEVFYWPTFDPLLVQGSRTQILDAFRDVRDGLRTRIVETFELEPPPNA